MNNLGFSVKAMRKASTHLTEEPKISGVMFALAVLFIIAILSTFNRFR